MEENTNQIQIDVQNKFNDLRNELMQDITLWQRSLYNLEFKDLINKLDELYQIIQIDQVIIDELVNQNPFNDEFMGQEDKAETALLESTIKKLNTLKRSLNIVFDRICSSLSGLGLYVFYPSEGEPYDAIRHNCNESYEDMSHRTIKKCIKPGYVKRDSLLPGKEDIILPALVSLE